MIAARLFCQEYWTLFLTKARAFKDSRIFRCVFQSIEEDEFFQRRKTMLQTIGIVVVVAIAEKPAG